MGFFHIERAQADPSRTIGASLELLHRHQCNVCPLQTCHRDLAHPDMQPSGSNKPLVYMLGEAPGAQEDKRGIPFVGRAGQTLWLRIPNDWVDHIRFNNCVRTRPPGNRTPTTIEIECCRPSIVRDIERTKPVAIFGFGNIPLEWMLNETGITKWNGRRIPVKVGNHSCWFFPMMHPSYVMRSRRFEPSSPDAYGSEIEFAFAKDLERAFKFVDRLKRPKPLTHNAEEATSHLHRVTGHHPDDLEYTINFLENASQCNFAGFDYETNALRPYKRGAKILTVAIRPDDHPEGETFAFPIDHKEAGWSSFARAKVINALEDFLYSKCTKIAHNAFFEMEWSGFFFGKDVVRGQHDRLTWDDTMSQAYVLDERRGTHSLDFLCLQYFGLHLKSLSNLNREKLEDEPLEAVLKYNALDAKYHYELFLKQSERLMNDKRNDQVRVYLDFLDRVPTMVLTALKGVPIDQSVVDRLHKKYTGRLKRVEDKISSLKIAAKFKRIKKREFRPSSTHDMAYVLHTMLNVPKGEKVTTNEHALAEIRHPIARLVSRWRKNNKIISTYIDPVKTGTKRSKVWNDGFLHQIIMTTATRTSRTSGHDPNMQNWPNPKEPGKDIAKEVREQIKPRSNQSVVAFDFGQIQARNIAMESNDTALVKSFWDREDIHAEWMQQIASKCKYWVPGGYKMLAQDEGLRDGLRQKAKNKFVFPAFFGAQPFNLSNGLDIEERDAAWLLERLWKRFPEIANWHDKLLKFYLRHGYVTGLSGVRRRAPIAQNKMINAPIQADEVLIVCDSMNRLSQIDHDLLQASMEIHDDLTFIWPTDKVEKLSEIVIEQMLKIEYDWINVPIVVERSIGPDWYHMKKAGVFASDTWNK